MKKQPLLLIQPSLFIGYEQVALYDFLVVPFHNVSLLVKPISMRLWSAPTGLFPYSFDEVVSVFWDRYPNSFAKHIVSEDVLERKVTENTIVTKKLIVKHGSSILKRVPRWLSRMTEIRTVPVIEESIYDRRTRTLTTYTRNVSHNELFAMHERCVYRPTMITLFINIGFCVFVILATYLGFTECSND
ncbi:hypothetical protein Y032_0259g484 [Ancylostoma ceylanicum]|uniref:PRELI/MSF1 domain-containing protein n=1 Tax=Ancylostoma ceylanicum TaxID=53326 RepID=A0A016SAD2_9BILA|nr:hypothetical protein Y032_0259g484 [Ancylostoma ceylanicum]